MLTDRNASVDGYDARAFAGLPEEIGYGCSSARSTNMVTRPCGTRQDRSPADGPRLRDVRRSNQAETDPRRGRRSASREGESTSSRAAVAPPPARLNSPELLRSIAGGLTTPENSGLIAIISAGIGLGCVK